MNVPQLILQATPISQEQQPVPDHTQVPARVRVAMGFLTALTNKTAPQALPEKTVGDSEVSYKPMAGQRLTIEEEKGRRTAIKLLQRYLSGNLTPTEWERWEMGWDDKGKGHKNNGMVMECPRCGTRDGIPRHTCLFCRGKGMVSVGLVE